MKVEQGGTQMWCPKCKAIRVCAAVSLTHLGHESGQRWHRTDHPDINWFRRGGNVKHADMNSSRPK